MDDFDAIQLNCLILWKINSTTFYQYGISTFFKCSDIIHFPEKMICPNAAIHILKSRSRLQSGENSSFNPIIAPGKVNENATITIIIIKSKGTRILLTFPSPSSKSLWEMNHIIAQPISIEMAMTGMKLVIELTDSLDCSKVVAKYAFGSAPHPLKKLKIT